MGRTPAAPTVSPGCSRGFCGAHGGAQRCVRTAESSPPSNSCPWSSESRSEGAEGLSGRWQGYGSPPGRSQGCVRVFHNLFAAPPCGRAARADLGLASYGISFCRATPASRRDRVPWASGATLLPGDSLRVNVLPSPPPAVSLLTRLVAALQGAAPCLRDVCVSPAKSCRVRGGALTARQAAAFPPSSAAQPLCTGMRLHMCVQSIKCSKVTGKNYGLC